MSAIDIVGSVFRITAELAPTIGKMIAGGVTEAALTSTLIAAAQSTAVERVNARAGHTTSPLLVMAVQLEDDAARLRVLGKPADARTVADIAADLRRSARGDEPTSERPLPPRSGR